MLHKFQDVADMLCCEISENFGCLFSPAFKAVCCGVVARFEGKEGYMTFMNSFVEEHVPEMRKFIDQLSVKDAIVLLSLGMELIILMDCVCCALTLCMSFCSHCH